MVSDISPNFSPNMTHLVHNFSPNMVHNMTQNVPIFTNCTTMAEFSKNDKVPDLQCGLELFNNNDLPKSLCSPCLALVNEQKIHSCPPLAIVGNLMT
jgi:hypothetical protein